MSKYTGWAIKLANGKFANDAEGDVSCALFALRRQALAYKASALAPGESKGCKIVRVTVTIKEAKP